MEIRVKTSAGSVEIVSSREFHQMFKVKYEPALRLPRSLPNSFRGQCAEYSAEIAAKVGKRQLAMYQRGIAISYVSSVCIAKVDDDVGFGLFADSDLKPGEFIGEYTGVLSTEWAPIIKKDADFNPYLLKYPFDSPYAVDAREAGNELRFMNHSSRDGNADRIYIMQGGILHVGFAANKIIQQGDQILMDYGHNYWRSTSPAELKP